MQLAKKIFFWVFGIVIFIVTIAIVLAFAFEKDIQRYAVATIKQRLKSEINIEGIDLTLLDKFPLASIKLSQATLLGTNEDQENDTLLYSEAIYFKFSVSDLWNKNYTINQVESENTRLFIYYDKNGGNNFDILKEANSDSSDFQFDLKEIILNDLHASYVNKSLNQRIEADLSQLSLDGNLSEKKFDLDYSSSLLVHELTTNNTTYLREKEVKLNVEMQVDYGAENITIGKGTLDVQDMKFLITGDVSTVPKNQTCDLTISGNNILLSDVKSMLPSAAQKSLTLYKSDGKLKFSAKISGKLSASEQLKVKANFSIQNGTITERKTKAKLTNIQLQGKYVNSKSAGEEQLEITSFSGLLKGKKLTGEALLKDLRNPSLSASLKGNIEADELQKLIHIPSVDSMNGVINFDISCRKKKNEKTEKIHYSGRITTEKLTLDLPSLQAPLQLENSVISIVDNVVRVETNAKYNSSDAYFIGVFKDLIASFFTDTKIKVEGMLTSDKFFMKDFIATSETKTGVVKNTATTSFYPENIFFNVKTKIKKFHFNNAVATNVSGVALLTDKELRMFPMRFKMAGGEVSGNMVVSSIGADSSILAINCKLKSVNIPQIFKSFDDFDQEFVSHKNIDGIGNSDFQLKVNIDNNFTLNPKTLVTICDLEVLDGALTELKVLTEIADYLAEDKRMRLAFSKKDLASIKTRIRDVHFGTLNNQVKVSNSTILIPSMLIESDFMDVQFSGSQTFSGKINYHFGFRFRDLKKEKKSEFGEIEDDGLGVVIHMRMTGTTDSPEISIDKKMMSRDLKDEFNEGKKDIKSALKEDFGLFKNDAAVQVKEDVKTAPEFVVDWEEDDDFVDDAEEQKDSVVTADEKKKFWEKFDLEETELEKEEFDVGDDDDF